MLSFGKFLLFILWSQPQERLLSMSCPWLHCHCWWMFCSSPRFQAQSRPCDSLWPTEWAGSGGGPGWSWGLGEPQHTLPAFPKRRSPAQFAGGWEAHGAERRHCSDYDEPTWDQRMAVIPQDVDGPNRAANSQLTPDARAILMLLTFCDCLLCSIIVPIANWYISEKLLWLLMA